VEERKKERSITSTRTLESTMQKLHKLTQTAQLFLTVALTVMVFSALSYAQTQTLTFTELSPRPVNGLTFRGVTFGFTISSVGSTDATYNALDGGIGTFVQDPSLEGNANGVLTLTFAQPTQVVSFGIARDTVAPLTPGATVQLFDANGNLIQSTAVNLFPAPIFVEGQFTY